MKKFLILTAIFFATAMSSFGQAAITVTQNQPVIQPLIAPYNDFLALNAVASTRSAFVIQDSSLSMVTLAASQNGSTVYLKALAGDSVKLPASATISVGTRFTVKNVYSSTSVGHCIETSGNDVFWGLAVVSSVTTPYTQPYLSTTNKIMLMTPTTTGGLAGGECDFEYIGYGRWNTHCLLYGSSTPATPFK